MAEPPEAKFQRLADSPYFDEVVTANRAYLSVAVPDAPRGAGEYWALTCLPATGAPNRGRRLSAVNLRWMETFVLYLPRGAGEVHGFVNLRQSALADRYGSLDRARDALDLDHLKEAHYRDTRSDGCQARGTADRLVRALQDTRFAAAVRALAASLLTSRTAYARFHNPPLTAAVIAGLGRRRSVM
jgi:hypothetical protein